jgi:ribose transport system ATP-binding protein
MQEKKEKILNIRNLSKFYPGVKALVDVDFDLYRGEVHCLVGKNGAGKSTLIEILAGSIHADKGKIEIFGELYDTLTPLKSISLGIQTIHQENQLVDVLTVAENIFLGDLKTSRSFFSLKNCVLASKEIFKALGVELNPRKLVKELSPVEKKVLSIAKAFSEEVKVLILDEPTASLDREVEEKLFKTIRNLTAKGVGIIYISHNIDEIFELGNRVTILRDGRKIVTYNVKDVKIDKIINAMIATDRKEIYKRTKLKAQEEELEVKNYSIEGLVKNTSFKVKRGEIFGIGGLVGSGRTELVRAIFGALKKNSGELIFNGKNITPKNPIDAISKGIGMLTEDRKKDGLIIHRPIFENINLTNLLKSKEYILDLKNEAKKVSVISEDLKIATPSIRRMVSNLSGGNQQKVVFAKWLLANSEIIILDEPTVGIDIGAKEDIYKLMDSLLDEGKIIIMISSDNQELVLMSDRIGVMYKGSMVRILEGSEKTEENVLKYSLGTAQ